MEAVEQKIGKILRERGLTLGTVESATGGLIAQIITGIAGSSNYFKGAIVTYSNEIKINIAGVDADTIKRYGAVSPQVAEEMAKGGREVLAVDICLSDTGIAGPGGATEDKTVGLFYLGLAHGGGVFNRRHEFSGSRKANRENAANAALEWLSEYLKSLSGV